MLTTLFVLCHSEIMLSEVYMARLSCSFMGKVVLFHIDQFWKGLRSFAFSNRTIFEFIFLLIYTFEQMLLILFTSTVTKPEELSLIISLFAVIVLTTFSLHKMVMDSRIRILEE